MSRIDLGEARRAPRMVLVTALVLASASGCAPGASARGAYGYGTTTTVPTYADYGGAPAYGTSYAGAWVAPPLYGAPPVYGLGRRAAAPTPGRVVVPPPIASIPRGPQLAEPMRSPGAFRGRPR